MHRTVEEAGPPGWVGEAAGIALPAAERLPDARPGSIDPLGVTLDANGANVALWSRGADAVDLCLFDEQGRERRVALRETTSHTFNGYVPGVRAGDRYGFRVHGPWDPWRGARWNSAKLLMDPYARAIDGGYLDHPATRGHAGDDDTIRDDRDSAPYVPRSVAVGEDDFDWRGDAPPGTPWASTVIYETHVKGQTFRHPGVPRRLRGTYAGLAHPAAIEHLTRLGVTAVELLPIHHFVSEDHLLRRGLTNYWGYNTLGFFAPHAGFSSSGSRGEQVTEFKQMVRELHAAGLEVILDVVYNHSAESDELGPTLSFRGIDNDAYYLLSHGRQYVDYSGCGNTLVASQPHVLRLIMDSLRYWVTEMHVDGFRFDLASTLARSPHEVDMGSPFLAALGQDPVLRGVKLIAEPWDAVGSGYQVGRFPPPWTEWNDRFRDAVRDYWGGRGSRSELGRRLTGSADLYPGRSRGPFASINFVTAHDGFTLRDLTSYTHKQNLPNGEHNRDGSPDNRSWNHGVEGETEDAEVNALRRRQVRNLLTTLLLSNGVPMITAGDELGRTQGGNNNAYCQDNDTAWVDWELDPWQRGLLSFTAGLIRLRRDYPVFTRPHRLAGTAADPAHARDLVWLGADGRELTETAWDFSDDRTLGMHVLGMPGPREAGSEAVRDAAFLLILNGGDRPASFLLPTESLGGHYEVVLDTMDGSVGNPGLRVPHGTELLMPPFSAKLLRAVAG